MAGKTKFTTDLENGELVATRTFDAPRQLVFAAYSSCDHIKNWWGPRTYPTTFCEMDFRPGGTWRYCMTGPEGDEAWGKGVYSEIVEPERIVYRDYFTDSQGVESAEMPSAAITVEFRQQNGRTELVSKTKYDSKEDLQKVLEMGVEEGFAETLDRLEEYLATQTT
ncbi:MAG TPA: SRPBCC domain-containing protein [Dehalococcoidia bacterium]|nr:SRPBCC domain-containing protein [Dehalococcoidia bacterium]